ncbi:hypothetical protein J3F83DRAFT_751779 [Trichoderma novae-zelandiae]
MHQALGLKRFPIYRCSWLALCYATPLQLDSSTETLLRTTSWLLQDPPTVGCIIPIQAPIKNLGLPLTGYTALHQGLRTLDMDTSQPMHSRLRAWPQKGGPGLRGSAAQAAPPLTDVLSRHWVEVQPLGDSERDIDMLAPTACYRVCGEAWRTRSHRFTCGGISAELRSEQGSLPVG